VEGELTSVVWSCEFQDEKTQHLSAYRPGIRPFPLCCHVGIGLHLLTSDEADSLQTALHAVMLHEPTFHSKGKQTERQPEQENHKTTKAKRKQDARESQSDDAPLERVLRAINNFKSDLGGLGKSVNEHGVKIEALTQAKQRNAGKENVREQNSGDQKMGKFAGAAVKGKGRASKPRLNLPTTDYPRR
jgi:hypothetical protein